MNDIKINKYLFFYFFKLKYLSIFTCYYKKYIMLIYIINTFKIFSLSKPTFLESLKINLIKTVID